MELYNYLNDFVTVFATLMHIGFCTSEDIRNYFTCVDRALELQRLVRETV
jgi:hypothetical protein